MPIRIAILEDNHDIRNGLNQLISSSVEFDVVGLYSNSEDFIKKFSQVEMDVVLVDIDLPGINGIKCVEQLKPLKPSVNYLICTVFEDNDKIFDSLCAGATGYILKNTLADTLFEAIRDIYAGGSPMSRNIARKVAASFYMATKAPDNASLSIREKEVLDYMAKGYRYKEIADKLFLSPATVRAHIRNIYEKLHVKSRIEALNKVYPQKYT